MKKVTLFFLFLSCYFFASAQLNPSAESQEDLEKLMPGKLFSQFASSIKPASFQSSFSAKRKSFIVKAKQANDAPGLIGNMAVLSENIKPEMFKNGFNVKAFNQHAGSAKTITQASGLLKELESGLKPEALVDVWKMQKTNWLAQLNNLK